MRLEHSKTRNEHGVYQEMYKLEQQRSYNSQSPHYLAKRPWMRSYIFQRIASNVYSWLKDFGKESVILNVGCGPGWLEKNVCHNLHTSNYIAMDISPKMARLTKNRVPQLDAIVADAETLPFRPNTIDAILTSRASKYFNHSRFFDQVTQVLIDEGSIGIILDCGDAFWVRFLERLGRRVDAGINRRTIKVSEMTSKLREHNFEVLKVMPISWLPPTIFSWIPRSIYALLAFFDKPLKPGRIAFIEGRKMSKAEPIKKENFEVMVCSEEGITTIA